MSNQRITVKVRSAPIKVNVVGGVGKPGSGTETGASIHAAAAATPASADEWGFWQSVGNVLKKITHANFITMVKGFLGTAAQANIGTGAGQVPVTGDYVPTTKHATLTVGTGNAAVTYEAIESGSGGEAISIVQAATSASAVPIGVSIATKKITVTPAGHYGIVVTDCGTAASNGSYFHNGEMSIPYKWVGSGSIAWQTDTYNNYVLYSAAGVALYSHSGTSDPTTGTWNVIGGASAPVPTMTYAAGTTAKQLAAAVNGFFSVTTPILILAKYGGDGSGIVSATITETNLAL
jgi:hypothetical protein